MSLYGIVCEHTVGEAVIPNGIAFLPFLGTAIEEDSASFPCGLAS